MLPGGGDGDSTGVDRGGVGIGAALGVHAGRRRIHGDTAGVRMGAAADSGASEAGAGVSKYHAPCSAAFSAAGDRACRGAGPFMEQNGAVGKMEAGGGFGAGVRAEFSGGRMAVCEFLDDAGGTKLVFRD